MKYLPLAMLIVLLPGCQPQPTGINQSDPVPKSLPKGSQAIVGTNVQGEAVKVEVEQAKDLPKYGTAIYPGARLDDSTRAIYIRKTASQVQTLILLSANGGFKDVIKYYEEQSHSKAVQQQGSSTISGENPGGGTLMAKITENVDKSVRIDLTISKAAQ